MRIEVEWNEFHESWDIDSVPPFWIHSLAPTREEAIQIARDQASPEDEIVVKGPRMDEFEPV